MIEYLLPFVVDYSAAIAFLSSFFGGEGLIMALSAMAANRLIPLWVIIVFCFLGTLTADSAVFLAARTGIAARISRLRFISTAYNNVNSVVRRVSRHSSFVTLFIAKFMYGTRMITIMIVSRERLRFHRFLAYDSIITAVWLAIVVMLGWIAGKGAGRTTRIVDDTRIGITITVLLIIITMIARRRIVNWIVKYKSRKNNKKSRR